MSPGDQCLHGERSRSPYLSLCLGCSLCHYQPSQTGPDPAPPDSGKSRIDKPKNCGKIAPNTPNAMRKPSRGKAQSEGETVQAPGRNSASHFQAARDDRDGRSRYRAAKTPGFFPVIRVVPRARASPLTWGRGLFVWQGAASLTCPSWSFPHAGNVYRRHYALQTAKWA